MPYYFGPCQCRTMPRVENTVETLYHLNLTCGWHVMDRFHVRGVVYTNKSEDVLEIHGPAWVEPAWCDDCPDSLREFAHHVIGDRHLCEHHAALRLYPGGAGSAKP